MRLGDFYHDKELTDALPPPGAGVRTPATTTSAPSPQARQQTMADPNVQRDLAQQQAADRAHEKKILQDQIRFKQKELDQLRKRLSDIT